MTFNERLKELRERKGLSQVALADKLGVSKSAVSMYERGERNPDFETLEVIADFFNVDMNYLLGKDDGSTYYLDPEAAEMAKEIFEDPNLRILFDASRKVSKEDLQLVVDMVKRLKKEDDYID